MPNTRAVRRLRDSRVQNRLTARLRRVPEERAFTTLRRLIAIEPKVGLQLANRLLRSRTLLEQLLRDGLAAGNASTIRLWIELLGKRLGRTRTKQIVREEASRDPAIAERAAYWLPEVTQQPDERTINHPNGRLEGGPLTEGAANMMKILERIDNGAYAEVYRATDRVGREVAVKIIQKSAGDHEFAVKQAGALARVSSPHVVKVLTVEEVEDPATRAPATGIVLELVRGATLDAALKGPTFPFDVALQLGTALCDGIYAIHKAGLAHGDLHEGNVMIDSNELKIIDILYYDSLATLSTQPREQKLRNDTFELRRLLRKILSHTKLSIAKIDEFADSSSTHMSVDALKERFRAAFQEQASDRDQELRQALARFTDAAFVAGDVYAAALADEVPRTIYEDLLFQVINQKVTKNEHREFVSLVWSKLSSEEQNRIAKALAHQLEAEIPKGAWSSHLRFLYAIGKTGWEALPALARLRLENAIIADILSGSHNYYGVNLNRSGQLGTWATVFWRRFSDQEKLVENIATQLRQGWDEQNYIGFHFWDLLPKIATTADRRATLIQAIKRAVSNDARLIVSKLHTLPQDWQQEVRGS